MASLRSKSLTKASLQRHPRIAFPGPPSRLSSLRGRRLQTCEPRYSTLSYSPGSPEPLILVLRVSLCLTPSTCWVLKKRKSIVVQKCPPQATHALVVLSADILSGGLAVDFVKISKEFITAGIAPTCLSNIDLRVPIHRYQGPILYEREEMEAREEVFGLMEPPFYHLV